MQRTSTHVLALLAALALLLAACASDDGDGDGATGAAVDAEAEANGGPADTTPGEWTMFGHDLTNSRFNPGESTLTADNVADLEVLWQIEGDVGVTSTPAVVDGVVYYGDWDGVLFAVDATDGDELWRTELEHGQVMSSPTVHDDVVLTATSRGLTSVERDTGEIRWVVETSEHRIAITPVAPVVADGLVLIGVASGELMMARDEYSFRGSLAAYDLATGEEEWVRWFTAGDETEGAGVGIWSNPSVDLDRGLVYVGTGNTYEPPQAALSNSVVALELRTGEVAWSTQFTEPDVWSAAHPGGLDADVGAGPNLFTAGGQDLVGAGDKRGDYYALDRDTGEIVWMTDMTEGSLLGGVIGTSAADDERIYVASNVGDPENNAPLNTSVVVALDVDGGEVLWEHPLDGAVFAPVSASPGLVFVATTAGEFHVLDAESGDELWAMEIPDQGGSGASIVDGVVYWGYGYALFGTGSEVGGLYALSPSGDAPTSGRGEQASGDEHPGEAIFRSRCASCHGMDGQGGTGLALTEVADRYSFDEQVEIVQAGRGAQMPAFGSTLDDEEIDAVVAYTREEL